MDQLIKSVLAIGSRFPPNDGAGGVLHSFTVTVHTFAVAFHVPLLKIRGETVQVLVIRQDGMGLGVEKVVIPDTQQTHDHREVVLQRRRTEVVVHGVGAA